MGELKYRLSIAVMKVNQNMLLRLWDEITYNYDVYFVIKWSHNEHLLPHNLKFVKQKDYSV
jgi:hypothetical protein